MMRHEYTIMNQSVNVLTEDGLPKNAVRPSIAERLLTVKKVSYFFLQQGSKYAVTYSKEQNRHRSIV